EIAGAFAEAAADVVVADLNRENAQQNGRPPDGSRPKGISGSGGCKRCDAGQSAIRYRSLNSVGSISWSTTLDVGLGNRFLRSPIRSGISCSQPISKVLFFALNKRLAS